MLAALALVTTGVGCSNADGSSSPADVRYAYVLMGPDGMAVARAITVAERCPAIVLDGSRSVQMSVHAAAAAIPTRTTDYDDVYTVGPAVFPVTTCDLAIPAGTTRATLGSWTLPLPKAALRRLILIGDTGCRMKSKPKFVKAETQACDDPTQWPFQAVADMAATFEPDLVVHLGDFHYRETPCPPGSVCADVTSYGFGWSSWEPDFFAPARQLLAAAPWIVIRGDHETCTRGGQGWWRFLDPRPIVPGQDCNDKMNDAIGNYGAPYVVPLDPTTVAIVLDTGAVSGDAYDPTRAESITYNQQIQDAFAMAAPWTDAVFVNHQPILAYNSGGSGTTGPSGPYAPDPAPGNAELQGVLGWIYGDLLFPGTVGAILSGHVHKAQITNYVSPLPPTFVAGNGGTNLILPWDLSIPQPPPYPGHGLQEMWQSTSWGFATMERTGTGWLVTYHGVDGGVANVCAAVGRALSCMH